MSTATKIETFVTAANKLAAQLSNLATMAVAWQAGYITDDEWEIALNEATLAGISYVIYQNCKMTLIDVRPSVLGKR